jgi:hypothetical protein
LAIPIVTVVGSSLLRTEAAPVRTDLQRGVFREQPGVANDREAAAEPTCASRIGQEGVLLDADRLAQLDRGADDGDAHLVRQ